MRSSGTTLGRGATDPVRDIQIDDARMSRQHSRIEHTASGWQLVDLESRNGGFVDGGRARARTPLVDGSVIRLGDTLMVFRVSPPADDGHAETVAFPGASPAACAIRRRIEKLAATSGHVLILGETGTGKERVARALSEHRSKRPYVTLNCAELTHEFVRSELFGHTQGSFTGATRTKAGLVEVAADGVLFLDEIGELLWDVQGDLLRFLDDGYYRPLGGELKHSSVRIVAATNVDLDHAVASTKFRRDLLARLRTSNAPLELPPLRERREDIPQWTRLFLREAGHASLDEAWTVGALECLLLYPWLENLRELRGIVRTLTADDSRIPWPTEALPARIRMHRATLRGHTEPPQPLRDEQSHPSREYTQAEIEDALRQMQGNVRAAAELLGIERRKFYRLCDRFEIVVDDHRGRVKKAKD